MKFRNLKYKSLLVGAVASMTMATSCKDFLDVDIYDQYPTLTTATSYRNLNNPLYGGKLWSLYEGKFSWSVHEGISGVLFNVYDQEGALFCLSIGDDNAILKEGYTSLYSGVIAQANQVVELVAKGMAEGLPQGMTDNDALEVAAEARLFRAYAHFMATELFGEVPLVWNSASDIFNMSKLPRVSRQTLYTAIEQDLLYAFQYLPEERADKWRATKYSAAALLAKLYLTQASCQSVTPGVTFPYVCSDAAERAQKAVTFCTYIIESKKFSLDTHANIFAGETRTQPSNETILALYWPMGEYAEGSAYQSQMAPSSDWSPGSGWGSGKGLSYTLYNSFKETDKRKKETCFYVGTGMGNEYRTIDGKEAFYGQDFARRKEANNDLIGQSGKEFLSSGQRVLNNIKKYIWGVDGTATHGSGMSIDRRQDLVRLSDIYMMRAEASCVLMDATAPMTPEAVADVNEVLTRHEADEQVTYGEFKFFDDMSEVHKPGEEFPFTVTVGVNGGSEERVINLRPSVAMFHEVRRADMLQQRRKEFAMEGQALLDLKRLFYRNPDYAAKFLVQMDRSVQFANSPSVPEGSDMFQNEKGYARLALVNMCNQELADMAARGEIEGSYDPGTSEEIQVFTEDFIAKNRWYLPLPSAVRTYLQPTVVDMTDQVQNGTYPY